MVEGGPRDFSAVILIFARAFNTTRRVLLLLAFGLFSSMVTIEAEAQNTEAGAPPRVAYDGLVYDSDGHPLAEGTSSSFEMLFRIWDAPTGGNLIWAERQMVVVSDGRFSVELGGGSALTTEGSVPHDQGGIGNGIKFAFGGQQRFLGVTVVIPPGTSESSGEVVPRVTFLTSPFSFMAERALTADYTASAGAVTQALGTSTFNNATFSGFAIFGAGTSTGIGLNGSSFLELGYGLDKSGDPFAGRILWDQSAGPGSTPELQIIGAIPGGGNSSSRKIHLLGDTNVDGNFALAGNRLSILPMQQGRGQFLLDMDHATFRGTTYPTFAVGYNVLGAAGTPLLAGEPSMAWQYETDYDDGLRHTMEMYTQFLPSQPPSAENGLSPEIRPIAIQVNRATNLVTEMSLNPTGGVLYANGDTRVRGQFIVESVGTMSAPTVIPMGETGQTSYSYQIVAKVGSRTIPSASATTTTTANATLSGANYNALSWPAVDGATGYDVYRVMSGGAPSSVGKIGSTLGSRTFNDTGLAANLGKVPSNTSGYVGILNTEPNLPLTVNGSASFAGSIWANSYNNASDNAYSSLALGNTGAVITRNVADANAALIVNQAKAGSSGDVLRINAAGKSNAVFPNSGGILVNRVVSAKTGDYNVLAADRNTFFTNAGAVGKVVFALPEAAAGLTYSFYVDAPQPVEVLAGSIATIQIAGAKSSTAGRLANATQGSCVTLVAISSTKWVTESHEGTWTVK